VDHFGAALRGYDRFRDEAELNASRALFTAAAALAAISIVHSLAALCAALAAASLGAVLFGAAKLRTCVTARENRPAGGADIGPTMKKIRDWTRIDSALARIALRESLPIWVAGLLSLLYFKMDTVFLRWMAGDAELGAYGAAYKLFEGSMMAPSVLLAVSFPQLARAHNEVVARGRLERQVAMLLLVSGVLVAGACLVGGTWLVRMIFGSGYERSVASLRVLALGLPLVYLNYGLTHFLVARDLGRITTWLALMMLVLNVALDLALIPSGKGPGAAWATVLSEIALTACCFGAIRGNSRPMQSLPLVRGGAKRDKRAA
jgi:O-antigen/teichoic acid export membrane protein